MSKHDLTNIEDQAGEDPTLLDLLGVSQFPTPKPKTAKARGVTKQDERRLDGVERIRVQREDDAQQVGYLAKPFLLLGLPFKPVKGSYYKRTNGNDVLEVSAGSPDHALPFGEDILVLIWVSTLAVLNKDKQTGKIPRVIEFRRAADMLKAFDLPVDGRTYERMQERFLRVFYANFYYGMKNSKGRAKLYAVRFFDEIDLWFTRDLETETLPGDDFTNNRIKLSEAFAADLEAHSPPIDLEAVRMWANAPGQLYFYMWLVFRCYVARSDSKIPLMGPTGIKEQCGVQGYDDPEQGAKNFRNKVRKWLAGVKTAWPDCPVTLTSEGGADYLTIKRNRTAIRERKADANGG